MSKSKGTFISARTYLNHLSPEHLRYYYACKISSSVDDMDLNLEDFTQRVNSDLVGKITNLGSRGAQLLSKKMDGKLCPPSAEGLALIRQAQEKSELIASHYDQREFSKAINEIRSLADMANKYFDEKSPWKTLESQPMESKEVISAILNIFRILTIYLKPILPNYASKVEFLFGESPYSWFHVAQILSDTQLNPYEHLITRIDPVNIKALVAESKK